MATNIYEIILTDLAKEELEDIYEYMILIIFFRCK